MLILASQSPRRRELLSMLGLDFQIFTADIDETMDPACPVEQSVAEVCRKKAEAVGKAHPGELIIAADTVVVLENQILGKPRSEEEACAMLRSLSGSHDRMLPVAGRNGRYPCGKDPCPLPHPFR